MPDGVMRTTEGGVKQRGYSPIGAYTRSINVH